MSNSGGPDLQDFAIIIGAIIVTLILLLVNLFRDGTHITLLPTPSVFPTETPFPDSLAYMVVKTEKQPDGIQKNTVNLSINAFGVGQLLLTSPMSMNLGDSDIMRLSISPDSALVRLMDVSVPTQNSDTLPTPFQFTDRIDIYPIMQADLSGAGFEITSDGQPQKVILSDKPTEWVWSIKPKDEGIQLITVRISIPVRIDGTEKVLDTPLKNIPIVIKVTKSLQRRMDDVSPKVIPALITSLASILIGIIALINNQSRERKIAELERRIVQDKSEKEILEKEIKRIKSIPIWQFWRK